VQEPAQGRIAVQKGGLFGEASHTLPTSTFWEAGDARNADIIDMTRARSGAKTDNGFRTMEPTLGGKWLELLSEIAPGLKQAAIMFNPDLPGSSPYMPSL
jgi:putative ABC transport system substrate-binding protein